MIRDEFKNKDGTHIDLSGLPGQHYALSIDGRSHIFAESHSESFCGREKTTNPTHRKEEFPQHWICPKCQVTFRKMTDNLLYDSENEEYYDPRKK